MFECLGPSPVAAVRLELREQTFDFEGRACFEATLAFLEKVKQFDVGSRTVAVGNYAHSLLALHGVDRLHPVFDRLDP